MICIKTLKATHSLRQQWAGAVAGIVIGSVVLVAAIAGSVFYFSAKKKKTHSPITTDMGSMKALSASDTRSEAISNPLGNTLSASPPPLPPGWIVRMDGDSEWFEGPNGETQWERPGSV